MIFRPGSHSIQAPRPNQLPVFKNVQLSFYEVRAFTFCVNSQLCRPRKVRRNFLVLHLVPH